MDRHYGPYWQGLDLATQVAFAGIAARHRHRRDRIDTQEDRDRDATRVCFALNDHPGIFSRLAGRDCHWFGANVGRTPPPPITPKDGFGTACSGCRMPMWESLRGPPSAALRDLIDRTA